jgi:hypothetical protein
VGGFVLYTSLVLAQLVAKAALPMQRPLGQGGYRMYRRYFLIISTKLSAPHNDNYSRQYLKSDPGKSVSGGLLIYQDRMQQV